MMGAALASMVRIGGSSEGASPTVVSEAAPPAGPTSRLVIPVVGAKPRDILDTWGQARGGGARGHQGTDIMAPGGTPVVAAAAGKIEKLFVSRAGGTTLYIRSTDGELSYYYAHLAGYAPGIGEGLAVRAGEQIGYVGDTGNSGAGNYHLHFAIARMRPGERWWQGEPINPYPLLAGARAAR